MPPFRCHYPIALIPLTLLCLAVTALSEMRSPEAKDTFFTQNATVHSAVSGEAYIGFASAEDFGGRKRPASPTVRFMAGSRVEKRVSVFNKSHVTIQGGTIALKATAYDSSVLTISSGAVGGGVYAEATSVVHVRGGSIGDGLYAADKSTIHLSGGSITNGLFVSAHGTVNISGGRVSLLLTVSDSGTLTLIGRGLSKKATPSAVGSDVSFIPYVLMGKLRDGTSVAGRTVMVQNKTVAKLILKNIP